MARKKDLGGCNVSSSSFYHVSGSGDILSIPDLWRALGEMGREGFVWFDFVRPSKEDLAPLAESLGLHPLAVEDCLDDDQIPKIDSYPGNVFLLVNTFSYRDKCLVVDEVNLFVGEHFLVTVSRGREDEKYIMNGLRSVLAQHADSARLGPSFALHVILDHIVDHKFQAIETIEDELIALEDTLLERPAGFDVSELQRLRRALLLMRKSLFHEREILMKICRKDISFIPENAIIHFNDIYDHLTKYFELVEVDREMLSSLIQMNISLLSNKMTESSNKTNNSVRRLTFITTIFMPLTLLAGIGGMSEWSMMTGPENWKIAYPVFVGAMAAIGIVSYFVLKWFVKRDKGTD